LGFRRPVPSDYYCTVDAATMCDAVERMTLQERRKGGSDDRTDIQVQG
jgi:hypothetical protein